MCDAQYISIFSRTIILLFECPCDDLGRYFFGYGTVPLHGAAEPCIMAAEGLRSSAEPRPVSDSVPRKSYSVPPSSSRVRGLHAEDSRSTLVPPGTTLTAERCGAVHYSHALC